MSSRRHILIVTSDRTAAQAMADIVEREGQGALHAGSGAEAMALMQRRGARIDLALIDTALPDGDGRELVSRMRRRGVALPLLLVSTLHGEDDVVWGLEAGADDYLLAPPRPRELVARIRVHLRAGHARDDSEIRIGPVAFRPASRSLLHPDMPCAVRLTEKEAALLMRLHRADGKPVSRQALLNEVWGYSPGASSHTVETHIYRLRRKIEPRPESPSLLVSESGGYRLLLDVADRPAPAAGPVRGEWLPGVLTARLRPALATP